MMFDKTKTGIMGALTVAFVIRRIFWRGASEPFLIEMPAYKVPDPMSLLSGLLLRAKIFLRRAGTSSFRRWRSCGSCRAFSLHGAGLCCFVRGRSCRRRAGRRVDSSADLMKAVLAAAAARLGGGISHQGRIRSRWKKPPVGPLASASAIATLVSAPSSGSRKPSPPFMSVLV